MASYDDDIITQALRAARGAGSPADPWAAANARDSAKGLSDKGQGYQSFYDAAGVPDTTTADILNRLEGEKLNEWRGQSLAQRVNSGVYSDDPAAYEESQGNPIFNAMGHVGEKISNYAGGQMQRAQEADARLSPITNYNEMVLNRAQKIAALATGMFGGGLESLSRWFNLKPDVSKGDILAPPGTGLPTALGTAAVARAAPHLFHDPHLAGTGHSLGANPHLNPSPEAQSAMDVMQDLARRRVNRQTPFYGEDVGPKGRIADPVAEAERLGLQAGLPGKPTEEGFFNPASAALLQEGVQPKQTVRYYQKQMGSRGGKLPPGQWAQITKDLKPDDVIERDWLVRQIDQRSPDLKVQRFAGEGYEPDLQVRDQVMREDGQLEYSIEDRNTGDMFFVLEDKDAGNVYVQDPRGIPIDVNAPMNKQDRYAALGAVERWLLERNADMRRGKPVYGPAQWQDYATESPKLDNYTEAAVGYPKPSGKPNDVGVFRDTSHMSDTPNLEGWTRYQDVNARDRKPRGGIGAGFENTRVIDENQPQRYERMGDAGQSDWRVADNAQKELDEQVYPAIREQQDVIRKLVEAHELGPRKIADQLKMKRRGHGESYELLPQDYMAIGNDIASRTGDDAFLAGYEAAQKQLGRVGERMSHLNSVIEATKKGVQPSPYTHDVQAATGILNKQMLADAAHDNIDRIAWTPGDVQAERYNKNLRDVKALEYEPESQRLSYTNSNGQVRFVGGATPPEKLPEMVGQDAADRLLKAPVVERPFENGEGSYQAHRLDFPQGMTLGGDGMRGFYGDGTPANPGIMGENLQGILRRVGQEDVGVTLYEVKAPKEYPNLKAQFDGGRDNTWRVVNEAGNTVEYDFPTKEAAEAYIRDQGIYYPSVPLKPETREKIKRIGLPLYAKSDLQDAALRSALEAAGVDPVEAAMNVAREEYKARFLPKDYYHGSGRIDRVVEKGAIDPKRATSGPMPYFTDDPELGSSYAMGKQDTSMPDFDHMSQYFTVSPKDLGHTRGRTPYTVEQSWNFLTPEQRAEIREKAPRVGYANRDMADGDFVLHPAGEHGGISSAQHWAETLKRNNNNPLAALRDIYLEGGAIFDEPYKLADIYKLAGYPHNISQTNAPWTEAKGVLPAKLRVERPLVTSNIDELKTKVIPALEEAFKRDRSKPQQYGRDGWDKNTTTPREWLQQLKDDIAKGKPESFVWTSIPDKVTEQLKRLGYDGIQDVGGKMGGDKHEVVIPFYPEQVRSKFAKFDPRKADSPKLLASDALQSAEARAALHASDPVEEAMRVAKGLPEAIKGYHGTQAGMPRFADHGNYELGPHFGNVDQANARLDYTTRGKENLQDGQAIVPVEMNFKNPLDIRDPGMFDAHNLPSALEATGKFSKRDIDALKRHEERLWDLEDDADYAAATAEFSDAVRDLLRREGYDALRYRNTAEHPEINAIMEKIKAEPRDSGNLSRLFAEKDKIEKRLAETGDYSYVPVNRGTVKSSITGNTLFSDNADTGARSVIRAGEAEALAKGERFDPSSSWEMRSKHWPKSWFEDYSTGNGVAIPREKWDADTIKRAKLFVRDMEARDKVNEIIDPLMYQNGQRVRDRVEAEQIALRDPEKADALNQAYSDATAFYEHTHPNWQDDPYGAFNYPRPPGDDSAAQAFIERIGETMKQAAQVVGQSRAAGVELPNRPFLIDQGIPRDALAAPKNAHQRVPESWKPFVDAYAKGGDESLAKAIRQRVPDIDSAVKLWETTPELGQLAWDGRPLVQQIADAAKHMARSGDKGIEDAVLLADSAKSAGARAMFDVDPLGYYSAALEAAKGLKQAKGTGEQMLRQIESTPGVKKAEISATGLDQFLAGKPSVTKQEIVDFLGENRVGLRESVYPKLDPEAVKELKRIFPDMTDAELARDARQQPAKWKNYSLDPSNPTYRETVMHLPHTPRDEVRPTERIGNKHKQEWDRLSKAIDEARVAHDNIVFERNGVTYDPDRQQAAKAHLERLDAEREALHSRMVDETIAESNGRLGGEAFKSGHWSEPNVIAHSRTAMYKDTSGKNVFLVDELQSDWAQKIRDGGARDAEKIADIRQRLENIEGKQVDAFNSGVKFLEQHKPEHAGLPQSAQGMSSILSQYVGLERQAGRGGETVWEALRLGEHIDDIERQKNLLKAELRTAEAATPGHPLVNTTDQWTTTALRRLIKQAVDDGADAIALTPGKVQNDRFKLSKVIDDARISNELRDGDRIVRQVVLENKSGVVGSAYVDAEGKIVKGYDAFRDGVGKSLSDYIGRDLSERMLNTPKNENGKFAGDALEIGGEGMRYAYDTMYPKMLGKILSKIDPSIKMETRRLKPSDYTKDTANIMGEPDRMGRNYQEYEKLAKGTPFENEFVSFPITDKVREAVKGGQAMFSKADDSSAIRSGVRQPLRTDEHGKQIVWEDGKYSIAANDMERPTYFSLWNDGKKVGNLYLTPVKKNGEKWMSVDAVDIDDTHRGNRLGDRLFKEALANLPDDVSGIYNYLPNQINQVQMPRINTSLGAEIKDGDHAFIRKPMVFSKADDSAGVRAAVGVGENNEGLSYLVEPNSKAGVIGSETGAVKSNGISVLKSAHGVDGYEGNRVVYAKDGQIVGAMQVMKAPNTGYVVANTYVRPEFRRTGIATELNDFAKQRFGNLDRSEGPSPAGAAFRQSLEPKRAKGGRIAHIDAAMEVASRYLH